MPIITLLPKEKEGQIPSRLQFRWFLWITWLIFILVILGTVFSFVYKDILKKNINATEKELKTLQSEERLNQIKELADFNEQLKNLKTILNNHVKASGTFSLIEDFTHPKIYWTEVNFKTVPSAIGLSGRAASLDVLSNQLASIRQNSEIKKYELSGISIDNKDQLINFNLNLELK